MKRYLLSFLPVLFFIACGGELPLEEMNAAKIELGRAEALRAQEFAPEEYNEARQSLFRAHDKAAEENASEARKLANYATSKAYDALERTLPRLCAQARDEATQAIDAADEAFATGLAPAEFDRAIALRKEGDQDMERGDQVLSEFLQEKDEAKRVSLRRQAFQNYERSYNHYVESRKMAEEARSLALNSRGELRQSARYVEEDLNLAETYLGGPNSETVRERQSLDSAYQDIENGELKKANEKIQTSRSNTKRILANSIQNYARERLQTASEVVEDSNARFEKLNPEEYSRDPELQSQYESARENLGAANEALASAGNFFSQEKYEDSITQSEEAIRLSEIALDQTSSLQQGMMARKRAQDEEKSRKQASEEPRKMSSKSSGLKEGWKKYTVRKTRPEDCLWRIADRKDIYGNARLWPRIYRANKSQIRNQDLIYPNQVLYIPPKTGPIGSPYRVSEEQSEKTTVPARRLNLKEEEEKSRGDRNLNQKPVNGPNEVDSGLMESEEDEVEEGASEEEAEASYSEEGEGDDDEEDDEE